ncbi:hypothetical protein [Rubellimicrobium arenae]|uniref:hypothetical protein n=1 Tax=Rubellimicrobium arenae TaxID=2817372 RepID=UPI001B30AAFC|nr:hypothetical protein [Rubellimicrobium arenae]
MTIITKTHSDFACAEDIAAGALQAGRRAAAGLRQLGIVPGGRVGHLARLLSSEALFEELALAELEELEGELHVLVEAEAYYVPAYGSSDAEEPISPDRRLTETGRHIERVRSDVAQALHLARYMLDLAVAERVVGRARGFLERGK